MYAAEGAAMLGLGAAAGQGDKPRALEQAKRVVMANVGKFDLRWRQMPTLRRQVEAIAAAYRAAPAKEATYKRWLLGEYNKRKRGYETLLAQGVATRNEVQGWLAKLREWARLLGLPAGIGAPIVLTIPAMAAIAVASAAAWRWAMAWDAEARATMRTLKIVEKNAKTWGPEASRKFLEETRKANAESNPNALAGIFGGIGAGVLALAAIALFFFARKTR